MVNVLDLQIVFKTQIGLWVARILEVTPILNFSSVSLDILGDSATAD